MEMIENSSILVVNDIEATLNELLPKYPLHSTRVIKNEEKEEFLIAQTTLAIKEAYIVSKEKNIFFMWFSFRKEAQNSLLKNFRRTPRNVVFILITSSKTSLLPTIYSRLPYKNLKKYVLKQESILNLLNLI